MTLKIGLIINPIAGVGAALAWKGTDNVTKAWEAIENGERQPVWDIAKRALQSIKSIDKYEWYLGGEFSHLIQGKVVYQLPTKSDSNNTKSAVAKLIEKDVDIILFIGGDGTAKDVTEISSEIPILGIPGGVKIFSPCFLHKPEDLGDFLEKWLGKTNEVDILDLDDEEYLMGNTISILVGSAIIPESTHIQVGKSSFNSTDDLQTYSLIAERIREENWLDSKTILVGPGSTMKQIFSQLDLSVSLLGVDIISNGQIMKLDCTETEINNHQIDQIWITPIGSQGHIFGRGNKQIGIKILELLQKSDIKIFSTPSKLLETQVLYLDIGNSELDKKYQGYYHVVTGYYEEVMRRAE
ncbi:MAG: hypothetical protein HeimC2_10130 [Candidatus Heimdallarchaeota archaeon LC_2]|nr:MAG: hypothetical protein HeimC2_10130 [Candidatus Heimdallarchaeota archaeon LC_2]